MRETTPSPFNTYIKKLMKHKVLLFLFSLLAFSYSSWAQKKASGVVIDGDFNEPLMGATIKVKGTSLGVVTDINGRFTLNNIPNESKFLEITYMGFNPQSVPIQENIKVILQSEKKNLGEVVVTGMQKMDKRLFSGATVKIDAEKMKIDGMADISRSLEGRAAGVSVQNVSGTFGSAPKIRVRGATSIYGSSRPLWVVDGVIQEDVINIGADELATGDVETLLSSAIAGLNADDIESFQILKDGSATSIYGARAMAGVIVITTKKGKAGVSRINYTGEFTTRMKPSYNNYNIMNSKDQMDVYREMAAKGWLNFSGDNTNGLYNAPNSGVYGKMWQLINTYDPTTGQFALANTTEARNGYLQMAEQRNTDWFDELFSNSIMQNHSISVSSGSDKATYYASLSVMNDPGWYLKSGVQRYTANLNTSYKLGKKVTLNLLSNAAYRKQNAPGTSSQAVNLVDGEISRDFDINPYSYALNSSRTLDPKETYRRNYADFNIFKELDNNFIELNTVDLKFQTELKWAPVKELELSVLGALKYNTIDNEHFIMDESNQANAYRAMDNSIIIDSNDKLYPDPDHPYDLPITVLPEGGIYRRTDYKTKGFDFRTSFSWNRLWKDDHLTNVYGGMETNATDYDYSTFNGIGMQYEMGETPFYIYQYFKQAIEQGTSYYGLSHSHSRSAAFFLNANYAYQQRYSVNGTVRYEGTNQLGRSRSARWLPTWNISGRWNLDQEKFFAPLKKVVSTASLKLSYSLTGDRGPNLTNSTAIFSSYNPFRPMTGTQESGLELVMLANDDLTYEKKTEFNVGLEIGLFDNRINTSMDFYTRDNHDLIGTTRTQGVGGEISKYANVAAMKSHGFELSISSTNIQNKNFRWTTDFIYSVYKNEVTQLNAIASTMDYVSGTGFTMVGYPHRGLFSIPFAGLDENGIPTFYNEKGEITSTDLSFQYSDDFSWLKYEGPTDPTFSGSLGNTFSYKNFRLNVYITYSGGNVVRLDPVFSAKYTDLTATSREFKNRWMKPGDEEHTTIPTILSYRQYYNNTQLATAYNAYNYSTERVADGGFIRLKEISLNYDFPKKICSTLKLSSLSAKLQATNLCLLYADKKLNGQDPEFINSGGVASPVPRQFTFTLRLGI